MDTKDVQDGVETQIGEKLAPFNPSNPAVISSALRMLQLEHAATCPEYEARPLRLYDLGCGDGRLLIQAVQDFKNVEGVGIEYDLKFASRARERVSELGMQDKVSVIHGNVLDFDFEDAGAIFVYLVPKGLAALAPRLLKCLSRGVNIVSYVFSVPGVQPVQTDVYKSTSIYLYTKASLPRNEDEAAGDRPSLD